MYLDPKTFVDFRHLIEFRTLTTLTSFVPIALALKKIYAPRFDMPESMTCALARIEPRRPIRGYR